MAHSGRRTAPSPPLQAADGREESKELRRSRSPPDRKPPVIGIGTGGRSNASPEGPAAVPVPNGPCPSLGQFHDLEVAGTSGSEMLSAVLKRHGSGVSDAESEITASPAEARQRTSLQAIPSAGCIHVSGPDGTLETLRISIADSPEAIDLCLRAAFGMPMFSASSSPPLLLRDENGHAVPLGPGLVGDVKSQREGVYPTYWLRDRRASPSSSAMNLPGKVVVAHDGGWPSHDSPLRGRITLANESYSGASTAPVSHQTPLRIRPDAGGAGQPAEALQAPSLPNTAPAVSSSLHPPPPAAGPGSSACSTARSPSGGDERHTNVLLPNVVSLNGGGQLGDVQTASFVATARPEWMSTKALKDEYTFWTDLASKRRGWSELLNHLNSSPSLGAGSQMSSTIAFGVSNITKKTEVTKDDTFRTRLEQLQHSATLDTSPQHIERLYRSWADKDGILRRHALQKRLEKRCGFRLSEEDLEEALDRVQGRFSGGSTAAPPPSVGGQRAVTPQVFASLWQRLSLGTVCFASRANMEEPVENIELIEYDEHSISGFGEQVEETKLLFGGRQRDRHEPEAPTHGLQQAEPPSAQPVHATRWAIIDGASQALIRRLGVKFWLHPLATEDAINAASQGTTKIDRYRHQYFISLEVYAFQEKETPSDIFMTKSGRLERFMSSAAGASGKHERPPQEVGPRISRSTVSLLATGNPPTSTHVRTSRDWMLAIVNDPERQTREDPLDRFASDRMAARKIIERIKDDLLAGKRQREYQADFLLYSIIDCAVSEMTPINNAYGRRLRWLQDRLDVGELSKPQEYVEEVSRVRLELQQLRQWSGQLKAIVHHLEGDCRGTSDVGNEVPWNFGADSRGQGKSMILFLRHTQDDLDQVVDRLAVLDDVCGNFTAAIERQKSNFMNQVLFLLTGATTVFLPAQFLAGVYGMNFEDDDGRPAIPELTWGEQGYVYFWLTAASMFLTGMAVVICCVHCDGVRLRSHCPPRCRGKRR